MFLGLLDPHLDTLVRGTLGFEDPDPYQDVTRIRNFYINATILEKVPSPP
jgi:hypothetical protein